MCRNPFSNSQPTYAPPPVAPQKTSAAIQSDAEARRLQERQANGTTDDSSTYTGGLGDTRKPKTVGISLGGA